LAGSGETDAEAGLGVVRRVVCHKIPPGGRHERAQHGRGTTAAARITLRFPQAKLQVL
jgi:hypothetical protein